MRVWWGAVAQLGERLVRNEEVSGSIPLSSTINSIDSTQLSDSPFALDRLVSGSMIECWDQLTCMADY